MKRKERTQYTERDLEALGKRIEHVGLLKDIADYRPLYDEDVRLFKERYPGSPEWQSLFFPLRSLLRKILLKDDGFVKYARFVSEPKYVTEVFEICDAFHRHGFDALPVQYKRAHEDPNSPVFMKWHSDPEYYLDMMARGSGKTVNRHSLYLAWDFMRNPSFKFLVGHQNINKAINNLKSTKGFMLNKWNSLLFPEYFTETETEFRCREGNVLNKENINIVFDKALDINDKLTSQELGLYRKENTIMLCSPESIATAYHFERIYMDDPYNEDIDTQAKADKLIDFMRTLPSLEEDRTVDLGESFRFKVRVTGTEQNGFKRTPYSFIKEQKYSSVFCLPAEWYVDGVRYQSSARFTKEYLDKKKEIQGDWFNPHYLMIPKDPDEEVKLDIGDDFQFCYDGEEAPEFAGKISVTRHELIDMGYVIVSKDPSYEIGTKKMDSDCSKDTTITGVWFNNALYVIEEFQQLGSSDEDGESLYVPFYMQAKRNKADLTICDAQGTQKFVSKMFAKKLRKSLPCIKTLHYTKPKETIGKTKIARAKNVLEQMFKNGQIKIHWKCKRIIDEVMRHTKGYDFFDTLIQIFNSADTDWYQRQHSKKVIALRAVKRVSEQHKYEDSEVIFKTAGY